MRVSKAFGSTPEAWMRMQTAYDIAQAQEEFGAAEIERLPSSPKQSWPHLKSKACRRRPKWPIDPALAVHPRPTGFCKPLVDIHSPAWVILLLAPHFQQSP